MDNNWVTFQSANAQWHIVFPKDAVKANPSILFHFAKQLCLMSAVYAIAQLEKIHNPIASWNHLEKTSYSEHLQEAYEKTGRIPFFYHKVSDETPLEDRRCILRSRICFHTAHGIQEESIDNLGELLRKIRPNLITKTMVDYAPVNLVGNFVIPEKLSLEEKWQSVFLNIQLHSNIWLPYVLAYVEEDGKPKSGLISNDALANCHSRRFNNWLKAVKSLAIDCGASWVFNKEGFAKVKMITEEGINLNYQPE
jgi:hypothetical protein